MKDQPIISSLLEQDFYKFAMGQMIFHRHPNVETEFNFINRSKSVQLGKTLDLGRLREELEHCRTLRFGPRDLHYIMGTYEYEQPMFELDYVQFLEKFKLPEFELSEKDGQLDLRFFGKWSESTYWEIFAMSIVNELYFKTLMDRRGCSRFDREVINAEGRLRLGKKLTELKQRRYIKFSDFGTRRRFSGVWQDYVVGVLVEEFSKEQFRGTSNVLLAQKYGVMPVGTNAHELPMAYSGIFWNEDLRDPTYSSQQVLTDWGKEYGLGLSLFLPDTFGSDWFFKNVVSPDQLKNWKGSRQDSGLPLDYAVKRIKEYRNAGIDPLTKMIVFADSLNVRKMIDLSQVLNGQIGYSFGWGTDLTNDFGFPPLSIVVKVTQANGMFVAKLSDNIEKATGDSTAIEHMKRLVGYTTTYSEKCKA